MRHSRTRFVIVPLALAALTLVFMMPFVRPPTGREALDGHDLTDQQYPLLSLIFDSVRDGHGLPLWNPYQFAGQSITANPQSTLYYPPAWIMIPLGIPRGVGWLIVLHLWIGAWGMAEFTRRLGASIPGALIGGAIYGFSALMGAHLGAGHFNYLLCQAWLPWIAAAYLWSIGRSWWAGLPGAAALGLCVLTGYPPLLYFALIWLGGLWLYSSLQSPSDRLRMAWRALRPLIVIVVGGTILGAALLLPVGQFILRSTRTQNASLSFSNSYAMPGSQFLTMIFPNMFGYPRLPDLGYWGLPFYEETTAYVGIFPLIALILALLRWPKRKAAPVLLIVFVVAGAVISLGIDGGIFPLLYWFLPGYSIFRVPARALYFVTVGAAGLSALLTTDLHTMDSAARYRMLRPVTRWILPFLLIFAILGSFGLVAYFTTHSADANPPWRALYSGNVIGIAAFAIGATWIVLRLWQTNRSRVLALVVTALVVLVDLWHISAPLVTVSAIDVTPPWDAMAKVAAGSPDYRVMTVPDTIIWQAGAAYTHHLNASGYDPLVGDDYQRLLDASHHNPTLPVAQLLGVRYAITAKPYEWLTIPGIEHLKLLTNEAGWYIYETDNPLPHAFVVPSVQVIADNETARQQIESGASNLRTVAIVDHAVACPSTDQSSAVPKITRYDPNTVDIDTAGPGMLVLTDSYDPNWTVTVDNTSAEVVRVDTALRGLCLPDGAHHIRFEYRPTAFTAGIVISLAGWIVFGLIGIVRFARIRTPR